MANEEGFITPEEYSSQFQDFYRPINIQAAPAPVASAPLPDLAAQSGIKVKVEKPDINVNIKKINDSNHNPMVKDADGNDTPYFNILSGTKFASSAVKHANFKSMAAGIDKVEQPSLSNLLSTSAIFGTAMKGDYGFGTLLHGPTNQPVFSAGKISEKALSNHMDNFAASEIAYTDMAKALSKDEFKSSVDYMKNNDTGFASVIGGMHFSRNPKNGYYEGHLGHLHSDSHTAHMMLKSMEALSKGLDPRGGDPKKMINLKGYEVGQGADNSENGGASVARSPNGMAAITEDGYYTYVSGGPLGHTKSKLYGGGSESTAMLNSLKSNGYNLTKSQMIDAMAMARSGKLTFTQAIRKYKMVDSSVTESILEGAGQSFQFTSNITGVGKYNPYSPNVLPPKVKIEPASPVQQSPEPPQIKGPSLADQQAEADQRKADAAAQRERDKETTRIGNVLSDRSRGVMRGFNTGGQVSSPVGQLASMLRSNRLGYNQGGAVQSGYYGYQEGGQINMQEMGFVNGKTPDQVTDAQSVADTEAMTAEEGDFVINAPAVEAIGVEPLIDLVSTALQTASDEGVTIVDLSTEVNPQNMVDILVSEGEFIVPQELIPFIEGGIETLEQINNAGKQEVSERVEETEMMPQGMPMDQEIPAEEIPTEPQQPVVPALNAGGMVRLDFSDRGFV